MDIHKNARLTLRSREALAETVIGGLGVSRAATSFHVTPKTAATHLRPTAKAERFIQTALRQWAYSTHWRDSDERNRSLPPWIDYYNRGRPHGGLNYQPPISRSEPGTTS
jgi:transposase InsO family protein